MTIDPRKLIGGVWKRKMISYCVLFLLVAMSKSAFADERCDPSMKLGTICSCSLSALHPTQISVGKLYVTELKSEGLSALTKHARKTPTKIAFGPMAEIFIMDGHHHAAAMSAIDSAASSTCEVSAKVEEFPQNPKDFWSQMAQHSFALLQGPDGTVHEGAFPPPTLNEMADDPFRSVAAWLEQACHLKVTGDYADFDLANVLRHDRNAVMPQTEADKAKALREALLFVHDPENRAALSKIAGADFAKGECK